MDQNYKKCILQIANEKIQHVRKPKYTNKYFLDMFIHILDDVTSYRSYRR